MSALTSLMEELHEGEKDLAARLRRAAHQHATDFDVHHGATQLSAWSEEHVARLAEVGKRFDLDLSSSTDDGEGGVVQQVMERTAKAVGRRPEPALVLLRDLRELHVCAVGNNVNWEMLGQAGQALRDSELVGLAEECRPQTVRQMQWTNTLIKELSPQTLTSV